MIGQKNYRKSAVIHYEHIVAEPIRLLRNVEQLAGTMGDAQFTREAVSVIRRWHELDRASATGRQDMLHTFHTAEWLVHARRLMERIADIDGGCQSLRQRWNAASLRPMVVEASSRLMRTIRYCSPGTQSAYKALGSMRRPFGPRERTGVARYELAWDVFSWHIPSWSNVFKPFVGQPLLHFLEVGSLEGCSACWLLDNVLTHPTSHLTCIDRAFQPAFDRNIAVAGAWERVTRSEGSSASLLRQLPAASFDFIYVDADHAEEAVFSDAVNAWPLLKPEGLLVFDDYGYDPAVYHEDPKAGIDRFLATVPGWHRVMFRGWQLCVMKLPEPQFAVPTRDRRDSATGATPTPLATNDTGGS